MAVSAGLTPLQGSVSMKLTCWPAATSILIAVFENLRLLLLVFDALVRGKLDELISEGVALWRPYLPSLRVCFGVCAKRSCGKSTREGRADAQFTGP